MRLVLDMPDSLETMGGSGQHVVSLETGHSSQIKRIHLYLMLVRDVATMSKFQNTSMLARVVAASRD